MTASNQPMTTMPDPTPEQLHAVPSPPARDWVALAREIGPALAERAAANDAEDRFVAQGMVALQERRFMSAQVPQELGGGGASYSHVCAFLRELALFCPSTALAHSMHQHLISANVWKFRKDGSAEKILRHVAEHESVLVSTGASDWIDSSGEAVAVEGGYRVSGRKIFGSGSPAGTFLMTSARYEDPEEGTQALHFPVPFDAEGVTIADNWQAHGMRGTGSHDVVLKDVFVPEAAIGARRKAGVWHPSFDVIVTVALPIVMSVYRGLAEAAAEEAVRRAAKRAGDRNVQLLLGEMHNALETTRMAVDGMIALANEGAFAPEADRTNAVAVRKTIAAQAAIATVEKAVEAVGGAAFYRSCPLERALRDVRAAHFHPMQEKRQHEFTGRFLLGVAD
jgi:alkylation response protein AidB-like acyl-CoA dehydrogenase